MKLKGNNGAASAACKYQRKGGREMKRDMKYDDDKNIFSRACDLNCGQLEKISAVLEQEMLGMGVTALIADVSGNVVARYDRENRGYDLGSLAALASANCASTDFMARCVGEKGFPLRFIRGRRKTACIVRINREFLLVIVSDSRVSLGSLRGKIGALVLRIKDISETARDMFLHLSFPPGQPEMRVAE